MGARTWCCIVLFYNTVYANIPDLDDIIPPNVFAAVIYVESAFDENAVGDDGKSYGLMQIQLNTARDMGFKGTIKELMDPETNIKYGTMYLVYLYKKTGDLFIALDAYNRGLGNVKKYPYKGDYKDHRYVGKVLKYLKGLKNE